MAVVTVTSVIKAPAPAGNTEIVTAVASGGSWGTIQSISWLGPEGKLRVGQQISLDDIPGSKGYGEEYKLYG